MIRQMPHNPESEAGVLGSVLIDPPCLDNLTLKPEDFYDRRHSILWEQLQEMRSSNTPMDAITIGEFLAKNNALEKVGGYDYLVKLQDDTLVSAHSQHYEEIVKEASDRRREIEVLSHGIELAYKGEPASDSVISSLMTTNKLNEPGNEDIITSWENAWSGNHQSIPWPYEKMNILTGGVMQGMHTVLCGRSGSGKSIFLANWYVYLGKMGIPFLACPFEDKFLVTKTRMAACIGKYSWGKVQRGSEWMQINDKWEQMHVTATEKMAAREALASIPSTTHFYDRRCRPEDLFSVATKYKAKYGIRMMVVDGAKDLQRPSGKYSDTGFDEEISQALCRIAEELDIAVVSVYHLTKIPENELISSLSIRGSGNIVSDARAVYALQSKGLADNGVMVNYDGMNQTTRTLDIVKSNHSALGRVVLETDLRKCLFYQDGEDE